MRTFLLDYFSYSIVIVVVASNANFNFPPPTFALVFCHFTLSFLFFGYRLCFSTQTRSNGMNGITMCTCASIVRNALTLFRSLTLTLSLGRLLAEKCFLRQIVHKWMYMYCSNPVIKWQHKKVDLMTHLFSSSAIAFRISKMSHFSISNFTNKSLYSNCRKFLSFIKFLKVQN